MTYQPIYGTPPQFSTSENELADGYYLKFYVANSNISLSMATDDTGTTLLSQCKLNPSGYPISDPNNNNTVFVPHMNAPYRAVLYKNKTDADNNETGNADWNVADVALVVRNAVAYVQTIADLPTDAVIGQTVHWNEYHPGTNKGGGTGTLTAARRHDGGMNVDPTRTFPTDWADSVQVAAWFADSGIDTDCFVRNGESTLLLEDFGVVEDSLPIAIVTAIQTAERLTTNLDAISVDDKIECTVTNSNIDFKNCVITLTSSTAIQNDPAIRVIATGSVEWRNLTVDCDSNTGYGVRFDDYDYCFLDNLNVLNVETVAGYGTFSNAYGLLLDSESGLAFLRRCEINSVIGTSDSGNIATGVYARRNVDMRACTVKSIYPSEDADGFKTFTSTEDGNCKIIGNTFIDCEKRSAKLQSPGNVFELNIVKIRSDLTQAEVTRNPVRHGVGSQHHRNTIRNNKFITPYFDTAIQVDAVSGASFTYNELNIVEGNQVYYISSTINIGAENTRGIRLLPGSDYRDVKIKNNTIYKEDAYADDSTKQLDYGVSVEGESESIEISGNTITGTRDAGIRFTSADHYNPIIQDNNVCGSFRLILVGGGYQISGGTLATNRVFRTWGAPAPVITDGTATYDTDVNNFAANRSRSV
jgi:hypothetical protein